jgi:hypothetical protein
MAKYLITYHGAAMPSEKAVLEQAKAAFGRWLQEAGKAVIDPGAPTRIVGQVATAGSPVEVEIGGYSILEASSKEEAVRILQSHPFVARGGTLQINEVIAT